MKRILHLVPIVSLVLGASVFLSSPAQAATVADCTGKADTFFTFTYNDGITDSGCTEKNDNTPLTNPGQVAPLLHVSCSDKIDASGRPSKSKLGFTASGAERLIVSFQIVKDATSSKPKTCSGTFTGVPGGGTGGTGPLPLNCTGDANTYFQFTYTDGTTDLGCAAKNDVTPVENPGQLAPKLHVSCSDEIDASGRAKKGILGTYADGSPRLVASYLIVKGVGTSKPKTCGDATPVPAGGVKGMFVVAGLGATALALGARASRRRRPQTAGL